MLTPTLCAACNCRLCWIRQEGASAPESFATQSCCRKFGSWHVSLMGTARKMTSQQQQQPRINQSQRPPAATAFCCCVAVQLPTFMLLCLVAALPKQPRSAP
jgi:hypothetical protein